MKFLDRKLLYDVNNVILQKHDIVSLFIASIHAIKIERVIISRSPFTPTHEIPSFPKVFVINIIYN